MFFGHSDGWNELFLLGIFAMIIVLSACSIVLGFKLSNSRLAQYLMRFSAIPWLCIVAAVMLEPQKPIMFFGAACPPSQHLDVIFLSIGFLVSITILILAGCWYIKYRQELPIKTTLSPRELGKNFACNVFLLNLLYMVFSIPVYVILSLAFAPRCY